MKRFVAWAIIAAMQALATGCSDHGTTTPNATTARDTLRAASTMAPDMEQTPFGMYPASCIVELPRGASITAAGKITRRDGSTYQVPQCKFQHATVQKAGPLGPAGPPPSISSWVQDAYVLAPDTTRGFSDMDADVIVPPDPAAYYFDTYYTFPGFEPSDASTILQPVLQYGGGHAYWRIGAWACPSEVTGTCIHSILEKVYAGDSISTYTHATCSPSVCNWSIAMIDNTYPHYTETAGVFGSAKTYTFAFGGVVEAYGIFECSQFPGAPVTWKNISLYADTGLTKITPNWYLDYPSVSPSCDQYIIPTHTSVTLFAIPFSAGIDGPSLVYQDSSAFWSAGMNGGVSPYTISWSGILSGSGTTVSGSPSQSGYLVLHVTDQALESKWDSLWVTVCNPKGGVCPSLRVKH